MIKSDQDFIRTCYFIYVGTFAFSSGLAFYLHLKMAPLAPAMATFAPVIAGALLNTLAVPTLFKQLQRIGAVEMLKGLHDDCQTYEVEHPECVRIADTVDKLILSRASA